MKNFSRQLCRSLVVLLGLLLGATGMTCAQFATPVLDGTITAAEYSNNTSGTWSMTWDDTYLYLAKTGGNASQQTLIYLDIDPILPATGGSNASGNTVGYNDYDMTPRLPFRTDARVYLQNGYIELRTRNGSGGWAGFTTNSSNISLLRSGNNREIRIRWASLPGLTGRPASFNWLGMQGSEASPSSIYDQTPAANYSGGSSGTPDFRYYYTVSSTASGAATNPFSRTSFTYSSAAILNLGAFSVYDFSLNAPGGSITRTSGGGGAWTVTNALAMLDGTLDFGSSSTALTAGSVAVGGSSTLRLSTVAGGDLKVSGNLSVTGTFQANDRSVELIGANQAISGGATPIVFDYLYLTGTGTKTSSALITVNKALNFLGGILSTGSSTLTLAGTAVISETTTSYLLGRLQMSRTLSQAGTAYTYPDGLRLTPQAAPLPGVVTALRTTGTAATGQGSSQSILRQYQLTAATSTGLRYDLLFPYRDAELNGIAPAQLALFRSGTGSSPWQRLAGGTVNSGARTLTRPGLTDLGTLTLGSTAVPLPVELTAFTATAAGNAAVRLAWATASEKNSATFDVERSADGTRFVGIGTVAAAGSSSAPHSYELLDGKLPAGVALLYYRLKQVDTDGTFSYSPVRTVRLTGAAEGLTLFPNPTHGAATLTGAQPGTVVTVFNALGHPVLSATADAAGTTRLMLPVGLPAGVYVVRAGSKAARLTVE
jgi:hypothetical protein